MAAQASARHQLEADVLNIAYACTALGHLTRRGGYPIDTVTTIIPFGSKRVVPRHHIVVVFGGATMAPSGVMTAASSPHHDALAGIDLDNVAILSDHLAVQLRLP